MENDQVLACPTGPVQVEVVEVAMLLPWEPVMVLEHGITQVLGWSSSLGVAWVSVCHQRSEVV